MINDRLEELIHVLKHNRNSFADEIDVSATIIYNIVGRRRSSPSFEVLEKIKNTFPQVNMNWIIAGEGEPLIPQDGNSEEIRSQVLELINRVGQFEELADIRDKHISVLQNKIDSLKRQVESK